MARAEMVGRYGSDAYTEGFRVTTTVPSDMQEMANKAILNGLSDYDERHGYRGPEPASRAVPRQPGWRNWASSASLGDWSRPLSPMSKKPA